VHLQHALAPSLRLEVHRPRLQQIGQADHADDLHRAALDDREARQPALRHAVDDDAQRLVGVSDRRAPPHDHRQLRAGVVRRQIDQPLEIAARDHALQSVIWSVIMWVGVVVVAIVGTIITMVAASMSGTLGTIIGLVCTLIYLGLFLAWIGGLIYGAIKSYGGNMTKLPVVGGLAEKWA